MLIKNNCPRIQEIGETRLVPGPNNVPVKVWLAWRNNPIIKAQLENGELEELTPIEDVAVENESGEFEQVASDEEIKDFSANMLSDIKQVSQANALVRETFHPEILTTWLAVEKRKQVIDTINKQLDLLKAKPEKLDRSKVRQISTGAGPIVEELPTPIPTAQDD
jgi:hypothetical protein